MLSGVGPCLSSLLLIASCSWLILADGDLWSALDRQEWELHYLESRVSTLTEDLDEKDARSQDTEASVKQFNVALDDVTGEQS